MSRQILLTGGAGFIGSHVARRLLARGDRITALDDFNDFYDPALKRANAAELARHPGWRLVEGDIRDAGLVDQLLRDGAFDAVIHLAARAGVRPSLHIFVDSKAPWYELVDDLPKHRTSPRAEPA